MSDYQLHSWGPSSSVASDAAWTSSPVRSLDSFRPEGDFWLEVAFDISLIDENLPGPTYYFLVCNGQGLASYVQANFYLGERDMTLKNVVLVHEYSYQHIMRYLENEVSEKCMHLTNQKLFLYLESRFNIVED